MIWQKVFTPKMIDRALVNGNVNLGVVGVVGSAEDYPSVPLFRLYPGSNPLKSTILDISMRNQDIQIPPYSDFTSNRQIGFVGDIPSSYQYSIEGIQFPVSVPQNCELLVKKLYLLSFFCSLYF